MKIYRCHLIKPQINGLKIYKILSKHFEMIDAGYGKVYITAWIGDKCSIRIFENKSISITMFEDDIELIKAIQGVLFENVNADHLVIKGEGHHFSQDIKNYKPTLVNKLRYKLIKILQ